MNVCEPVSSANRVQNQECMSTLALELIKKEKRERTGTLNLGKCGLTELPKELFECTWLEELILSDAQWDEARRETIDGSNPGPYNQIKYLPSELSRLINLSVLKIGSSHFEKGFIDDIKCLENLTNLTVLDLSFNRIKDIRPLRFLKKLQYLDLSNNYVTAIDDLIELKYLNKLLLNDNNINDITILKHLPQIQYLDLSVNPILDFSTLNKLAGLKSFALRLSADVNFDFLYSLTNLRRLDLSGNIKRSDFGFLKKLTSLTDLRLTSALINDFSVFENLSALQYLDISGTPISDISKIKNLANLEYLNIGQTLVSDLSSLEGLTNLESLDIMGNSDVSDFNPLKQLVKLKDLSLIFNHLQDLNFLNPLKELERLSINQTGISDIGILAQLEQLQNLDISDNQIDDIQPLAQLKRLKILYATNNQITNLEPLRDITTLKILGLSENNISDVSPLVGLENLEYLSLDSNAISEIGSLSRLPKLQRLHLKNNKLQSISPLLELKNLWSLDLGKNQIADLQGQGIERNLNFVNLNLSNNPITTIKPLLPLIKTGIPVSLNRFDGGLNLSGLPLIEPPPEIVQQGNAAIITYFEALEKQGADALFEAKMLIIGEGGAGKTSLLRKLIDPEIPLPKETESTPGIDIHQMVFPVPEQGKDFTMHVWDFGGQEIYHATHQFFLTRRSLYILVIDNRKEENYDYWLQVQKLYSENSPLVIVQNEKGGRKKELPLNEMRERFPNIQIETFAFDFKLEKQSDKESLKALETFIKKIIQTLPHIGEMIPHQWANIRKSLKALAQNKDFISREQYLDLCAEHGILEEASALFLSGYLHALGVFLHFQDDVLLAQTLFLQNDWVTGGVYALIDGLGMREGEGRWLFDEHTVSQIWRSPKYKNKVAELVALIEKFELCYEVSKKHYLMPQLLPGTRPVEAVEQLFKRRRSLQLRYRYSFMPKGLLSRLMVRLHRFIKTQDATWNSGMVLYHPTYKSWAEIVETYGEREIRIWVKGGAVREFATLLTDEINLLHSWYAEMSVHLLLPCICSVCMKNDSPHLYRYDALLLRRERGKATIECPISYEDVNVKQVIEKVFVTPKPENPLKVFISYSKADEAYKKELLTHLKPLQRQEHLITWDDERILPGEDWNARIRQEFSSADIVLVLLSSDALATDYIWDFEIKQAVEQSASGKSAVVPIIVRSCDWISSPLGRLSGLPRKAKPITAYADADEAWQEVITGIREVIEHIKAWR